MSDNMSRSASENLVEDQDIRARRLRNYWQANTALIRNLLIIWAFVSLGCSILLVPLLNNLNFGSVPLGFWMAQQGSIFVFVLLTFVYAIQMDQLDRKYGKK